jgi:ribosomal protein S18 acetylase RimI-like enzyme
MQLVFRQAAAADVDAMFDVRAATRENPISRETLARSGITPDSLRAWIAAGTQRGWVCERAQAIVGFCNVDPANGEVVVLAVLPQFERRGIGRELLARAVAWLQQAGHRRIWLTTDPSAAVRSHGFYRAQGFAPTGVRIASGDEELVYAPAAPRDT